MGANEIHSPRLGAVKSDLDGAVAVSQSHGLAARQEQLRCHVAANVLHPLHAKGVDFMRMNNARVQGSGKTRQVGEIQVKEARIFLQQRVEVEASYKREGYFAPTGHVVLLPGSHYSLYSIARK